jgi:hypothetical protein
MSNFEYAVIYWGGKNSFELDVILNERAQDGWRTIAVTEFVAVLEREKEK